MNASMGTSLFSSPIPNENPFNRVEQMNAISEMHARLAEFIQKNSTDDSKKLSQKTLELIAEKIEQLQRIVKPDDQKDEEQSAAKALGNQRSIEAEQTILMRALSELFSSICREATREMAQ